MHNGTRPTTEGRDSQGKDAVQGKFRVGRRDMRIIPRTNRTFWVDCRRADLSEDSNYSAWTRGEGARRQHAMAGGGEAGMVLGGELEMRIR